MNSQTVAVMSGARLVEELSRPDVPTGYMQVASGVSEQESLKQ